MTTQDTMRTQMEIDVKKPMVSCDFVSCFVDSIQESNILLQDGDVISIPNKPNRVNVSGRVNNPGFLEFTEKQTME